MINNSKDYILELLEKGKRFDNRKGDFREVKIEYGASENAEGSAHVKLGKTEVIAGVKMNVSEPYPDSPDKGSIIVTTEFSQIASPEFESGPPSLESIEISRVVDRTIRESGAIDLKKLAIKKGEAVWAVFIDIYIMNHDGNLMDASSIAAMAALVKAKMPKLTKDNKVEFGTLTSKSVPIKTRLTTCTIAKIGDKLVPDPVKEEEEVADARITIGTAGENIHSMQKGGIGGFTEEEVAKSVEIAVKENKKIQKLFEK